MTDLNTLIAMAKELNASDVHIVSGLPVRCRVDGSIRNLTEELLTFEDCENYGRAMAGPRFSEIEEMGELDLAQSFPCGARTRINLFRQQGSLSAAIRLLAERIPELEELNLPPVVASFPDYRSGIVLVTGEQFTNEVTEAIRHKTTDQLRDKYRDKDMLLVDDIQFIAGKEATQIEFFNTFNNLHEAGHQIVLTSDRPPSDMVRLEERLRSRFEWGLMADIQPPDYETRAAIVREKALQMGLDLPKPVLEYIAENITSNVRQIEGTVKKLLAYQELDNASMDPDTVIRAVRDLIRNSDSFMPSPEIIIEETGKCYGIDVSDIMGSSRTKEVTIARQVSMYIIRNLTKLSLPEIGRVFGRDHSTVIHSLEKVEGLIKTHRETAENIRDIKSNVNARTY